MIADVSPVSMEIPRFAPKFVPHDKAYQAENSGIQTIPAHSLAVILVADEATNGVLSLCASVAAIDLSVTHLSDFNQFKFIIIYQN